MNAVCHSSALTDAELLAAYRASRCPVAFAALVARHGSRLLRLCRRRLACHQDAEDACQAVLFQLARRPERVCSSLPGWLYQAGRRAAKDLRRSAERRARREAAVARRGRAVTPAGMGLREELEAALASLTGPLREAVALRYLEGLRQKEAARLLGCPPGTVASRTHQGLRQVPVNITMVVTVTATLQRTALGLNYNAATLSFKAVNATTGIVAWSTGNLPGSVVSFPIAP